jgi:hypothetical protein
MSTLSANLLSLQGSLCLNGVYPAPYLKWPGPCYRTKSAGHPFAGLIPSKRSKGSSNLPCLGGITACFRVFLKILCRVVYGLKINYLDGHGKFHQLLSEFTNVGNSVCLKREGLGINVGSFELLATFLKGSEQPLPKC